MTIDQFHHKPPRLKIQIQKHPYAIKCRAHQINPQINDTCLLIWDCKQRYFWKFLHWLHAQHHTDESTARLSTYQNNHPSFQNMEKRLDEKR